MDFSRKSNVLWGFLVLVALVSGGGAARAADSAATEDCLSCHATLHPGILGDWKMSRHARTTPKEALQKPVRERRISSEKIPDNLLNNSIGCAECHTLSPDKHKDSFEHNGYPVHVVVSPADCAACHSAEHEQFAENIMSQAYGNLVANKLYQDLEKSINGPYTFREMLLEVSTSDPETRADSCLFCHGTAVEVTGVTSRETDMGTMSFPVLTGWPSQGVGRVNPDGSKGACAACHARHQFAIEVARQPATCSQCHKGPDVPAYKVYSVSKHGNIYASLGKGWDFAAVPWKLGQDFTAPTCAVCHASLLVAEDGTLVAERTHRMNDRLPSRLFGLIYAHPHPKSPDTSIIKNQGGLPLPTELTGEPVAEFLIDAREQAQRTEALQRVCLACHSNSWVDGHWKRLENTIKTSNALTLTSTQMMQTAWAKGLARGLAQNDSIFNEAIERQWSEQWLFYANSMRFSSAMLGGDYGVFDQGRWFMTRNLLEMEDWLKLRLPKGH
jgi:hydroxylamine dehydrogenase